MNELYLFTFQPDKYYYYNHVDTCKACNVLFKMHLVYFPEITITELRWF